MSMKSRSGKQREGKPTVKSATAQKRTDTSDGICDGVDMAALNALIPRRVRLASCHPQYPVVMPLVPLYLILECYAASLAYAVRVLVMAAAAHILKSCANILC